MIWKDDDLFDIARNIEPIKNNNELLLDLSPVKANGHENNKDNRLIECLRLSGDFIEDYIKDILISFDKNNYISVYNNNIIELDEKKRLEINLCEKYRVKYIKIIIKNKHISLMGNIKIEVLNRKFPGIILAALPDGYGDKFITILHAMYAAKRLGWKFGFRWNCDSDNVVVTNIHIENKEYIFANDFIEKYHYDKLKLYDWNSKNLFLDFKKPIKTEYWGAYVNHSRNEFFQKSEKEILSLWENIHFSEKIDNLFKEIYKIIKFYKQEKQYISIHIRSGDIVYNQKYYMYGLFNKKTTPCEIAMELIMINKNKRIVLFGDDIDELRNIQIYFKKEKIDIDLAIDILPKQENDTKQVLQEIIFMAQSSKIYLGSDSSFARLACMIGCDKEKISWQEMFEKKEQLKILKENFNKIELSNEQKAHSKYQIYVLQRSIDPDNWEALINIIEEALKYQPDNIMFKWLLIECYIKLNNFEQADKEIANMILKYDIQDLLDIFNKCRMNKHLKLTFSNIFESKYKNLDYLVRNILFETIIISLKGKSENNFTAVARVKNYLSYKLGNSIIQNSKSLLGFFKLPFIIIYLLIEDKIAKKALSSLIKLPNIETLPDYNEALKYKDHINYKVGQTFLKSCKNWHKGELIVFIFKIIKFGTVK